jgi:DNA repair exonuclease SbcCD ATPase subunit
MNITALTLENFGKFKKFECDFTPGLNVIKGDNESGKTTIVTAIAAALYGNPEKQTVFENANWNARSSGGNCPDVKIKAAIDGADFNGLLEKDFGAGKVHLANRDLNLAIDDNDRILEIITGAVGIPTAELFQATACVRQGEITHIGDSIEVIKNKLESLVTGGLQDLAASDIVSRIDKRISAITSKDAQNPGLLQRIEKSQAEIDYNIDKLKRSIAGLKNFRNSLAQVETAYANTTDDYLSKKDALERLEKQENALLELADVGKKLDECVSNLDKARTAAKKISELQSLLDQTVDISAHDREQVEELESTLKYLRPKQRELEKDVENASIEYDSYSVNPVLVGATAISLAMFVFSIIDFVVKLTAFYFHIGGAGMALFMISALTLSRTIQKRSFLKEQLAAKSQKLAEAKKEIEEQSQLLKSLLIKYRISSADQIRQIAWKRDEMLNQLKMERDHFESYLGGVSETELEQQCRDLRVKEAELKELIQVSKNEKRDPAELERLRQVVAQLEEQRNTLAGEITVFSRQLETAEGGAELLASYIERRDELSARKIKLVEELSILGMTKECIEQARQNIMISTLEVLESRTSEILQMITAGKYSRVRFDKSTLKFEVFADQKNGWVDPEKELSKATVEQIYLTARLALTELLAEKSKPPIILDDPFDSFDSQRLDNTMKMLKQLAADRQILLLTSDDRFDRYADHTIQLQQI